MSQAVADAVPRVASGGAGPIRVLYITDALYMGADTKCEALLLDHLDKHRYTTAAVTLPKGPAAERIGQLAGVGHLPIDLGTYDAGAAFGARSQGEGALKFARGLAQVALTARRFQPDVVLCGDRTRAMIAALVAARVAGAALVYHPGSFYTTNYANHRIKLQAARSARLTLTNSRFSQASYVNAGVVAEKVRIAYNGIDEDRFSPGASAGVRATYGIPEEKRLIGMFSQLRPYKGHDTVLKALPRVLAAVPNAQLLLAGPGELRADMEALASALGVAEHVTFTGHVDNLVPLYRTSDVFIMASDEEPFGMVTIEAMACEKAAIGTSTGGTPEIIAEGETGLLVPPRQPEPVAEALIALLSDPARCREMGRKGRERVLERFTLRGRAQRVSAALEQLVAPAHTR